MSIRVPPPEEVGPGAPGHWRLPIRRSLPEMLAERIVEAIRIGILKPGERVVELRLARELGVSRGPLREALRALEASGIVENRRGGTVVRRVSDDDLAHMVTMRAGLEGLAARFVAAAITDEQLATLSRHIAEMEVLAAGGRTAEWRDHDWRFHETIIALAGNPHLLSSWRAISNLVRLFLHSHPGFVKDVPQILANHDRMLAALASGDADQAERTFRAILLGSAFQRFGLPLPRALETLAVHPPLEGEGRRRSRRDGVNHALQALDAEDARTGHHPTPDLRSNPPPPGEGRARRLPRSRAKAGTRSA